MPASGETTGSYVQSRADGSVGSQNGWKARAQMEGLLWKNIRGLGLAYGASVSQNTDAGRSASAAARLERHA